MRAVVMAGGRGERLRPLTDTVPKPLLPVAGRPVLDRLLEKVERAGIREVTIAVGYLGEQIERFVGDGRRWDLDVDYVREPERMGTAGALSLLKDKSRPALVINGDKILSNASDLNEVMLAQTGNDVIIGTVPYAYIIPHGVVERTPHGIQYREKPVFVYEVIAGIYSLCPEALQSVPEGKIDMPEVLEPFLNRRAVSCQGYVLDIGTPATYEAACARLQGS